LYESYLKVFKYRLRKLQIGVLNSGAFRLYDVDNDGYITRSEMYNIVDAIYQMVVSIFIHHMFSTVYGNACFNARGIL
jgi:Ca2+-binding EF-hand superfamily protein